MKHGSLFSGIGGFDLAAEWMGWDNVFHCEWNEFGRKILEHYWPKAISYNDITKSDFTVHRGRIDILTGGFPCQPYSTSGLRKGKADERHLWPEMLRCIREVRPTYVVGENVLGIVNWNGGLVFEEVQNDLENEGYEVQAVILPACGVDAPHRRERTWFIAYSDGAAKENSNDGSSEETSEEIRRNAQSNVSSALRSFRLAPVPEQDGGTVSFRNFPTEPPICSGNDGLPEELDGITVSKWENETVKGYGNAIVPQVAFRIFKAIQMAASSS